jgi:threonine dehydrogenase-like Zn-dependent dehydrogenase
VNGLSVNRLDRQAAGSLGLVQRRGLKSSDDEQDAGARRPGGNDVHDRTQHRISVSRSRGLDLRHVIPTVPNQKGTPALSGTIAVMTGPGELEYQTYDLPKPAPGSLLLRVVRANVCGSELHIWRGHHPVKKRGGIGHEMVGRVLALGEGVTTDCARQPIAIGDRIVATYFQTCLRCPSCVGGQYNLCDFAYEFFARQPEQEPHFHSAFSTHMYIHPRQNYYKVPDSIPDSIAASANCALSQVYFGLDRIGLAYGETLVIQGAGGLGLMGLAIAKSRGNRVIVVDGVALRLNQARAFGADHIVDMTEYPTEADRIKAVQDLTDTRGADVGMEVTGVPAAFNEGVRGLVRRGGRYLVMGNLSPGFTIDMDPGLLTRRAVQIMPVDRYDGRYLLKALKFLEENIHRFPFADLLDADFTLDEVKLALDKSARREVTRASIICEAA